MLLNRPVLSLRIGRPVATTLTAIINPDNLKIEGFYCDIHHHPKQVVLLSQDIRDVLSQGVVINDLEVLSEPAELVRLEQTIKINFSLLGKTIETASGNKLGKVNDFAVDVTTMYVQKLYLSRSLFKTFSSGDLIIDRSQIVEITNKKIVVNDLEAKVPAHAGALAA